MEIRADDLSDPAVHRLLEEHLADMRAISLPESKHALDLAGLRQPDVAFFTVWGEGALLGCGALKELDPTHGEIKSMRTAAAARGRGVATLMVERLLSLARARGYTRVSLETGAHPFFSPAHRLYHRHGFRDGPPFAGYREDPNSRFMCIFL